MQFFHIILFSEKGGGVKKKKKKQKKPTPQKQLLCTVQYSTVFQVVPRATITYFALWEEGLLPFGNFHLPRPKPHYNLFFPA